jgi:hypothetical protein
MSFPASRFARFVVFRFKREVDIPASRFTLSPYREGGETGVMKRVFYLSHNQPPLNIR